MRSVTTKYHVSNAPFAIIKKSMKLSWSIFMAIQVSTVINSNYKLCFISSLAVRNTIRPWSSCNADIYNVTYTLTNEKFIGASRVSINSNHHLGASSILISAEKVTLTVRSQFFNIQLSI